MGTLMNAHPEAGAGGVLPQDLDLLHSGAGAASPSSGVSLIRDRRKGAPTGAAGGGPLPRVPCSP
jgi:hypothetical protein